MQRGVAIFLTTSPDAFLVTFFIQGKSKRKYNLLLRKTQPLIPQTQPLTNPLPRFNKTLHNRCIIL
jgi:hypothetical protein